MKKLFLFPVFALLLGCTSTQMVTQWKNPNVPVFESQKILVIGMTSNQDIRLEFEEKLAQSLKRKGLQAVRSIDFFGDTFQNETKSEADMDRIEAQLLDAGFDTILISKVTGSQEKVTRLNHPSENATEFTNFREYYLHHQGMDKNMNAWESYTIYHTESSVFCICSGKERELLWNVHIDVTGTGHSERDIQDYVTNLIKLLKENQMVLVE